MRDPPEQQASLRQTFLRQRSKVLLKSISPFLGGYAQRVIIVSLLTFQFQRFSRQVEGLLADGASLMTVSQARIKRI
jgi:hypothetical protein